MTLQQKLLAKKSKKGFTLVELVVVIAILAILAAIAIPAVVGIIDNAQKSAKNSNASALDGAAKKLYAGVTAGSISKDSAPAELGALYDKATSKTKTCDGNELPAAKDTTASKRSAAQALKVWDAVSYGGLTSSFNNENPEDYGYSKTDGTIVYFNGLAKGTAGTTGDGSQQDYTQFTDFKSTTLKDLYG